MAAGPKTVTLVDRDGNECNVSTPADINSLVYGAGYKVKGSKTPDEAIASLAEQAAPVNAPQSTGTATK